MLKNTLPVIVVISLAFILNCGAKLDSGAISPMSMIKFESGGLSSMINSVYPDNNSTGISRSTSIRVYFAVDMNPASFSGSPFIVSDQNNTAIAGTVTYANKLATFTPASLLDNSKKYSVTLATTITDTTANPIPPNQRFEFTTVDLGSVPAPEFSLMGGPYTGIQNVTLTSEDAIATIHYTIDGSTPSKTNGTACSTGAVLSITANTTVKAMAERAGLNDSTVTTAIYKIIVDAPIFNYAGGTYNTDIDIDITCTTPGAVIHYTTDGSNPTIASPIYSGTLIPIGGEGTFMWIKAIAVKPGMENSALTSVSYTISYSQAADPTFNPPSGVYTSSQSVIIDTTSPGATIRYTTDMSDPVTSPTAIEAPAGVAISVNDNMTINAYVVSATMLIPSNVSSAMYLIAPTISSISPNNGESTGAISTTITGTYFKTGATARLTMSGQTDIPATGMSSAGNTITCSFDIGGAAAGQWNVVVDNIDGGSATLASGFRVYALPAGLAGWWPLDGNYLDTVGGNNGSASGTINFVADRFGNTGSAGSCSAMMNKVIAPIIGGIPYNNMPRTMMGWVKADALHTAGDNYLFGYGQIPELFTMSIFKIAPNTGILIFDAGNGKTVQGKTLLHTGQWYHVAVTYDGATSVNIYVNGTLDVAGTISAALSTVDGTSVQFFQFGSLTPWLEGALDDVRIYNGMLPQSDIQTLASNTGYLVPPQNFNATRGTSMTIVTITWAPVLDATGYNLYRSTTLGGPYSQINGAPIAATMYTDSSVTAETIYYYKATAINSAIVSGFSDISIGYAGTPPTTFTESFETGTYDPWWTGVIALGTPYVINSIGNYTGSYGLYVGPSACSSGCGFNNEMRFTKDFSGSPITYFALNLWFCRQTMNGGEVRVYVNNMDPSDTTGMISFFNPTQPTGWIQRSLFYVGDPGSITSITIVFYDITLTNWYYADDVVIIYK